MVTEWQKEALGAHSWDLYELDQDWARVIIKRFGCERPIQLLDHNRRLFCSFRNRAMRKHYRALKEMRMPINARELRDFLGRIWDLSPERMKTLLYSRN